MLKIRINGNDEELKVVNDFLKNVGLVSVDLKRYPNKDNKTYRIYTEHQLEDLKHAIEKIK